MIFLDSHKERYKELAAGILKNYYRVAKLFCEMNDLILNWKRISKGLPRAKNLSRINNKQADCDFCCCLTSQVRLIWKKLLIQSVI